MEGRPASICIFWSYAKALGLQSLPPKIIKIYLRKIIANQGGRGHRKWTVRCHHVHTQKILQFISETRKSPLCLNIVPFQKMNFTKEGNEVPRKTFRHSHSRSEVPLLRTFQSFLQPHTISIQPFQFIRKFVVEHSFKLTSGTYFRVSMPIKHSLSIQQVPIWITSQTYPR